jgi:hypothetical protein
VDVETLQHGAWGVVSQQRNRLSAAFDVHFINPSSLGLVFASRLRLLRGRVTEVFARNASLAGTACPASNPHQFGFHSAGRLRSGALVSKQKVGSFLV